MENSGWKPNNVEIPPNCPRCGSSNTKFCYYNNYSLTQPRYFCKGCRRYWTRGGSLRNVPVGGGCRKNRRGNKTLRQSIDGLNFRNASSTCGGGGDHATGHSPIGHCYEPRRNVNSPSSSSGVTEGPNIDLAQVYANFLHQKPADPDHDHQLQTVFDPSHGELGLNSTENIGEGSNNQMCYSTEFNTMQRLQKDTGMNNILELPPMPGEELQASHHHVMWPNSDHHEMMMINHNAFQVQEPPLLGPDHQVHHHDDIDADLLMGNWCPFDLPTDHASFSRP